MTVPPRPTALIAVGAGLALLGGLAAAGSSGYRVNFTPSAPLGLWRIAPLDRAATLGDRVFICPPLGRPFDHALARGYLRPGLCPGGSGPLIKWIAARGGQRVAIGRRVLIDGRPLAASAVRARDAKGRALVPAPSGTVPAGFVFLHSPFRGSYDSRYFGPIPAAGILGRAEPVLTVAPE